MSARYIFRMDDITPTMDWNKFWSLLSLFMNHGVKPLLGIVPDNRDPKLNIRAPHPHFWDIMRHLQERDLVDFSQHGYQHTLEHRPGAALLGTRFGIKEMSEFAGEPYTSQLHKIRAGKKILEEQGIRTSYWMAPNHSFDRPTLRALRESGFTAITDGIALFPFMLEGLLCVPQQTWYPRWMPFGVQTICLHSNDITPSMVQSIRRFLRRPFHFSRFSREAASNGCGTLRRMCNSGFSAAYQGARALRQHQQVETRHQREAPHPEKIRRFEPAPLQPSHPGN